MRDDDGLAPAAKRKRRKERKARHNKQLKEHSKKINE